MRYDDSTGATMGDAYPDGPDIPDEGAASVGQVIDIALAQFAEQGFQDTKLDHIARDSGMSKRMIHYHFGDKKGLYRRCLVEAFSLIHPSHESLTVDTGVPVEGVTQLVDAVYLKMVENPAAIRILALESLHDVLHVTELSTLANHSEVLLHLDKLLMIGQDAGAFRPGISAEDLFLMIWSLAFFRVSNRDIMVNLFDIDTTDEENTEGMRRMTVDAVLAFLTSNVAGSGRSSYLSGSRAFDETQSAADIYGAEDIGDGA